eukprot:2511067-Prymnesium_polylepis.1
MDMDMFLTPSSRRAHALTRGGHVPTWRRAGRPQDEDHLVVRDGRGRTLRAAPQGAARNQPLRAARGGCPRAAPRRDPWVGSRKGYPVAWGGRASRSLCGAEQRRG